MNERPRDIWTRLAIDPLADPLAARLAARPGVTPNRITGVSATLGIAAAGCLAAGLLRAGGALFLLRFFADCLDGKVARIQGSASTRGATFDVAADVVCVTAAYAGLAWWSVRTGHLDSGWAVGLLAAVGLYSWALAHRKHLAASAGLGTGGADLRRPVTTPVVGRWAAWCRRRNMSPVPWSVEAETVVLGLLPLLGLPRVVTAGLVAAVAFYLLATAVNLRRLARIAAAVDERVAAQPTGARS